MTPKIGNMDCFVKGIYWRAEVCEPDDPDAVCQAENGIWLKPIDSEAFKDWLARGANANDIPERYRVYV